MAEELRLRSVAQQLYVRALSTAWRNGVQLYDPTLWLIREPELEEKILRDADCAHAIGFRRHLIAGKSWQVATTSKGSARGQMAVHVADSLIRNIKHFTQARMNLARSFFSGARFGEVVLEPRTLTIGDGKPRTWAVPTSIKDMDKRRFRIVPHPTTDAGKESFSPTWEVWDVARAEFKPQTLDGYRRTIRHVYADDEATLGHGRGLREALGWWWYAKEHVFHESLTAVEKFAGGTLMAKIKGVRDSATGAPNTELIRQWTQVLEDLRARNVLVLDSEDEVEMMRQEGTGWQLLTEVKQELKSAIFTLVLGANLTTSADKGGSYALAEIQENSTEALVQFDREALEETLSDDLIGCLWFYNYANICELGLADEPQPKFKITQEKKNDPKERAEVASTLHAMGVPLTQADVYEQTGFRVPEPGEAVIKGQEAPQQPPPGGAGGFGPAAFRRGAGRVLDGPARPLTFAGFDESKHPRDDHGRFVSGSAIQDAAFDPAKADELRSKVTNPEERKKLEAALANPGSMDSAAAEERKPKRGRPSTEQRREQLIQASARAIKTTAGLKPEQIVEAHDATGLQPKHTRSAIEGLEYHFADKFAVSRYYDNPTPENASKLAHALRESVKGQRDEGGNVTLPKIPGKEEFAAKTAHVDTINHIANVIEDPVRHGPTTFRPLAKQRKRALEVAEKHKGFDAEIKDDDKYETLIERHQKSRDVVRELMMDAGYDFGGYEPIVDEMQGHQQMAHLGFDKPNPTKARLHTKQAQSIASAMLRAKKMGLLDKVADSTTERAYGGSSDIKANGGKPPRFNNNQTRFQKSGYSLNEAAAFYSVIDHEIVMRPDPRDANPEKPAAHSDKEYSDSYARRVMGGINYGEEAFLEATGSLEATTLHEFGHAMHGAHNPGKFAGIYTSNGYQRGDQPPYNGFATSDANLVKGVSVTMLSRYGRYNPHELIAETYTRMALGQPVDQRVMQMYKKYGGYIPAHVRERAADKE